MIAKNTDQESTLVQTLYQCSNSHYQNHKNSPQSSSKSKSQNYPSYENNPTQPQDIKSSPHLKEYTERFIRGRKISSYNQYWKNFAKHDINALPNKIPFKINIIQATKNYRIIKYQVCFSHFVVKINILNVCQNNQYSIFFDQKINHGTYGTIFCVKHLQQTVAIKKIDKQQNTKKYIQNSVKEYAFMKVMAAMQCGPCLNNIFGFDMIVSDESVYFALELCLSVQSVFQSSNFMGIWEQKFDELEMSLLMMHELGFCHCDIKPSNIMYSPSLKKFVFIDFGLSEYKNLQLGEMKLQRARGCFFYSCQEMQKLFVFGNQCQEYVDVFYNDYYGLMKSKIAFESSLKDKNIMLNQYQPNVDHIQNQNQNNSEEKVQFFDSNFMGWVNQQEKNQQKREFIIDLHHKQFGIESDYLIIAVCFLVSQTKILQLKAFLDTHKSIYEKLNQNLHKIYWIFLEINFSLARETVFLEFKQLFLKNCTPSFRSKYIFENILDPYFKKAVLGDEFNSEPYINYKGQMQKSKQKIQKQYLRFPDKPFILNQSEQTPQKQLNEQFYQLPEHFYPEISSKPHQYFDEKRKIRISLTSLDQERKQQIKKYILSYCDCVVGKIIKILKDSIYFGKIENKFILFEIPIIEQCFSQINIFFNDIKLARQGKIDPEQYTVLGLNIITEVIIEYVTNFSIPHVIYYAVQHDPLIEDSVRNKFKLLAFMHYPNLNQEKYEQKMLMDLKNYFSFSTENLKNSLIILVQLVHSYVQNNSYTQESIKIDNLVANVVSKFNQILQYHQIFSNKKSHHQINHVLQTLLLQISSFILDSLIDIIFAAQSHYDFKRLNFYYSIFLDFYQVYQKTPTHNFTIRFNDQKSYLQITKKMLAFIIFKTILPKRLNQKYKKLGETQKFILLSQLQNYQLHSQHLKRLQNCLFRQYFTQMTQDKLYGKAMNQVKNLMLEGNKFTIRETIFALIQLYRTTNNNKLLKMVKNRNKRLFPNEFKVHTVQRFQPWKRYFLKCMNEEQNELYKQRDFCQQQQKKFHREFIKLKRQFPDETNVYSKQFRIKNLIDRSVKATPLKDTNLQLCIDLYQSLFKQIEQKILDKLQLLQFVEPNLIWMQNLNWQKKKNAQDDRIIFQYKTMIQLKKQIYSQQILYHESQFIQILAKLHTSIKNKELILQYWHKYNNKITNIFQGKQVKSLHYLEISARIKQLQFLNLYMNPQSNPEQTLKAKKLLISSINQFILQFTPQNQYYPYEFKNSNFGIDALIKIYNGQIPTDAFTKKEIRQRLIEVFNQMIKNDQLYQFFTQNQIMENYSSVIIEIGMDQIYEKVQNHRKRLKNKNLIENLKVHNKKRGQSILSYFLDSIAKFAEVFPCSNYTRTILTLSNLIKNNISKRLSCQTFQRSLFSKQDSREVIIFVLQNVLKPLFNLNSGIYTISIYFDLLNFVLRTLPQVKTNTQNHSKHKYSLCQEIQLLKRVLSICHKNKLFQKMETYAKNVNIQNLSQILSHFSLQSEHNTKHCFYQILFFRNFRNPQFIDDQTELYYDLQNERNHPKVFQKSHNILQSRLKGFSRCILKNCKSSCKFQKYLRQKVLERLNVCFLENR